MKKILLLATGGTIASAESGRGLAPSLTPELLLSHIPEVHTFTEPDTVRLFDLDSTNITPDHWLAMARAVRENYDRYDGFVITHGTDTMAYTAAALSYLIQDADKPIVLTGGQKSIDLRDTDARRNLYDSFLYAADPESRGVVIVFNGEVIPGTRARKERTKSYNAFASVDHPSLAVIRDHRIIRYVTEPAPQNGPVFSDSLEEKILLVRLIPGMRADAVRALPPSYEGLILQTFGAGGLPGGSRGELAGAIAEWRGRGKTVVIMTQVPYEGSDMSVYEVGKTVKEDLDVIEACNMTTEAVVTKLMWAMGQTKEPDGIRELFLRPVARDIL